MSSFSGKDNVELWLHTKLDAPWQGERIVHAVNADVLNFILSYWPLIGSDTTLKLRILTMFLSLRKNQLRDLQSQLQKILSLAREDSDEWLPMISSLISTMLLPEGARANYDALMENDTSAEVIKSVLSMLTQAKSFEYYPLDAPYLESSRSVEPGPNPHFTLKKTTPRWKEIRERTCASAKAKAVPRPQSDGGAWSSGAAHAAAHSKNGGARNPLTSLPFPSRDRFGGSKGMLPKPSFSFADADGRRREPSAPKSTVVIVDLEDLNRLQEEQRKQERLLKDKENEEKNAKRAVAKKRKKVLEDAAAKASPDPTLKTEPKKRGPKKQKSAALSPATPKDVDCTSIQSVPNKPADLSSDLFKNITTMNRPPDLSSQLTSSTDFFSRITNSLQSSQLPSPELASLLQSLANPLPQQPCPPSFENRLPLLNPINLPLGVPPNLTNAPVIMDQSGLHAAYASLLQSASLGAPFASQTYPVLPRTPPFPAPTTSTQPAKTDDANPEPTPNESSQGKTHIS